MKERRDHKFMLSLTPTERKELQRLADLERLPAAAVVRRLILREAKSQGCTMARREVSA